MTVHINYCTRCGDELLPCEVRMNSSSDGDLPPLCLNCLMEVFSGMFGSLQYEHTEIIENGATAMRNVLEDLFSTGDGA